MHFPKDFVWGAAAAAYQIEGGTAEGGRGPCVWDMLARKEGAIFAGHNADVACDHYHRWREDIQIMKDMGLHAYRMSFSWTRILPAGTGKVNEQGLKFYDQIINTLLDQGITPFVTLFHWDYPYDLFCRGGWLNPNSPEWFANYAQIVAKHFGDRVTHWMTLNEPQCYVGLGHRDGIQAPGLKLGWAEILRIVHNSLLAHGRSVMELREHCARKPIIGFAPVGCVRYPATDSPEDIAAAKIATLSIREKGLWNNTLFGDPVCLGQYPEDAPRIFGKDFQEYPASDMETIHQKLDFYGVNIYQGEPIAADPEGKPMSVPRDVGHSINAYHWPITPTTMRWGPRFLYERYKLPVYITENGMSGLDWVGLDGAVHDPQRIDFTRRYLRQLALAIQDGVDCRGYFHWSLLDNFEWADGFRQRFGLVHVDYCTQKRTLKDSAHWYAAAIRNNGQEI